MELCSPRLALDSSRGYLDIWVRLKLSCGPTESRCESGSKLHALHTLPRRSSVPGPHEVFGVRPAYRRSSDEGKHLADSFNLTGSRNRRSSRTPSSPLHDLIPGWTAGDFQRTLGNKR